MSTETLTRTDEWNPTTLQKVAAFAYTLASFKVAFAALAVGALVGAFLGQWLMYAAVLLIYWFNGKTAYETATFPATGQRVYGIHDVETKASAQARKAAGDGEGQAPTQ